MNLAGGSALSLLLLATASSAQGQERHLAARAIAAMAHGLQDHRTYIAINPALHAFDEDSADIRKVLRGDLIIVRNLDSVLECGHPARQPNVNYPCHIRNDPQNDARFIEITGVSRTTTSVTVDVQVGGFGANGLRSFIEDHVVFPRNGDSLGTPVVHKGRHT